MLIKNWSGNYQRRFQSTHFVSFAVNEYDVRRLEGADEAARLLVVGVSREADVRNLVTQKQNKSSLFRRQT